MDIDEMVVNLSSSIRELILRINNFIKIKIFIFFYRARCCI